MLDYDVGDYLVVKNNRLYGILEYDKDNHMLTIEDCLTLEVGIFSEALVNKAVKEVIRTSERLRTNCN